MLWVKEVSDFQMFIAWCLEHMSCSLNTLHKQQGVDYHVSNPTHQRGHYRTTAVEQPVSLHMHVTQLQVFARPKMMYVDASM